MTTAARPTWDTAKGGRGKGEGDLSALSKQYSSRDLPSHTKLKHRLVLQIRLSWLSDLFYDDVPLLLLSVLRQNLPSL